MHTDASPRPPLPPLLWWSVVRPLQVPFRLTRMMIKAMEVSGIEGNFRTTCEAVLKVLRTHKDSLMVSETIMLGTQWVLLGGGELLT